MRFWFIVPEHRNYEGLLISIALRMRITFFSNAALVATKPAHFEVDVNPTPVWIIFPGIAFPHGPLV